MPSSIRQLNREVHNTKSAYDWDIYSNNVVTLKKVIPFVAKSPLVEEDESPKSNSEIFARKHYKMSNICIENLDYALNASQKTAWDVLKYQMRNLEVDIRKDQPICSWFRNSLNSNYFNFKIPNTPMHGDFKPHNAIINDGKLYLTDWEYALPNGSIIYDWWFLKTEIEENKSYKSDSKTFFSFLKKVIKELGLTQHQFNAFGCAMHTVVSLSRLEVREGIDMNKFYRHFHSLSKIVSRKNRDLINN